MRYYTEHLHWNDGTIEQYEVLHRDNKEAIEYAKNEFAEYPQVKQYQVVIDGKTILNLVR